MNTIPSKPEIDALAGLYIEAETKAAEADALVSAYRDQLAAMVAEHGFLPPKASKSKRLLGAVWKITSSGSSSIESDGTEVLRFRARLGKARVRIFRLLFRRETIFVPRSDANEAEHFLSEPEDLAAYRACFAVKHNRASLKVEPIQKEEKAKK